MTSGKQSRVGPHIEQVGWGILGAATAATFAAWLLVFPESVPDLFAWDVHPRYAQVFIGTGYIFRTAFFLYVARQRDWFRLRWIIWGNLVFTGTLLFATYWHVEEFNWNPFQTPLAHLWIVLYIFEPVAMIYLIPRSILGAVAPATGGPLVRGFKPFLIFVAGLLLMNGLLILLNPEFAAKRWPWELNGLDARIASAWFLGWAVWLGTMAFATDWDEIRGAALLFLLNGVALIATALIFRVDFLPGRGTAVGYVGALATFSIVMALFVVLQERRRPGAHGDARADQA